MKQLLEVNLLEGKYYFQKEGIFFKSKIKDLKIIKDDFEDIRYISLEFENGCGCIDIYKLFRVKKISRPANIINKFDWCFAIKNDSGDFIGYLGKPTE